MESVQVSQILHISHKSYKLQLPFKMADDNKY